MPALLAAARGPMPWYIYVLALVVGIPLALVCYRRRQRLRTSQGVAIGPEVENRLLLIRVAVGAVALFFGAVVLAVIGPASILP
jgi:hypothetical protein